MAGPAPSPTFDSAPRARTASPVRSRRAAADEGTTARAQCVVSAASALDLRGRNCIHQLRQPRPAAHHHRHPLPQPRTSRRPRGHPWSSRRSGPACCAGGSRRQRGIRSAHQGLPQRGVQPGRARCRIARTPHRRHDPVRPRDQADSPQSNSRPAVGRLGPDRRDAGPSSSPNGAGTGASEHASIDRPDATAQPTPAAAVEASPVRSALGRAAAAEASTGP